MLGTSVEWGAAREWREGERENRGREKGREEGKGRRYLISYAGGGQVAKEREREEGGGFASPLRRGKRPGEKERERKKERK